MPFFIWSFLHTKLMSIPCLPRNAVGYRDMNMIVQSVGSDLAKNYNHYYHLRNHASSHITYHSISMCSSRIFSLPHLAGITKQQNLHVSVVMLYHVLSTLQFQSVVHYIIWQILKPLFEILWTMHMILILF